MAYLNHLAVCKASGEKPLDYHDFKKRAIDLDTKWRAEHNLETARCNAEARAAREHNQKLGPKIVYELLVENSQLVGSNGPPVVRPKELVCPSCHAKYDWTREAEGWWQQMNGENISVPTEQALREYVEKTLYQNNTTVSALFCHNLVEVEDYKHGRSIIGSRRRQECGARLLTDYRVLPRQKQ